MIITDNFIELPNDLLFMNSMHDFIGLIIM